MLNSEGMDFETSRVAMLSSEGRRVAAEKNAAQSAHLSKRQEIQSRTRQVANAWSKEERFNRICTGIARRAWLLDLIDQT